MEGEGIDLPQDEYDGNALREDCYVAKVARVVKADHVAKCEKTAEGSRKFDARTTKIKISTFDVGGGAMQLYEGQAS